MVTIAPLARTDLTDVVALHRAAFEGHAHAALGDAYARALFRRVDGSPSGVALVAQCEGRVSGYALGIDMAHLDGLQRGLRPQAIVCTLRRPWIAAYPHIRRKITGGVRRLLTRQGEASLVPRGLSAPVMGLLAIGVAGTHRREGIGRSVLAAFEQVAADRGARSAVLSVYARNGPARGLYEAGGWVVSESASGDGVALYYTRSLSGLT